MTNPIKALLFKDGRLQVLEELDQEGLDEIYRLIECNAIDIVERWIGGKPYRIICDDEGMYAVNPKISFYAPRECYLVGNLIITGHEDNEGYLTSLSVADILNIRLSLVPFKEGRFVLRGNTSDEVRSILKNVNLGR